MYVQTVSIRCSILSSSNRNFTLISTKKSGPAATLFYRSIFITEFFYNLTGINGLLGISTDPDLRIDTDVETIKDASGKVADLTLANSCLL